MSQLQRTVFAIPGMDCPSEENLIRMALADLPGGATLRFDLARRELTAVHAAAGDEVLARLEPLGLGARAIASEAAGDEARVAEDAGDAVEARTLKILLAINAVMFAVEVALGLVAESTGLLADGLDMLADAVVYGLALAAVGRAAADKARAARFAGWAQLLLAAGLLVEVGRRFAFGSEPQSALMVGVGLLALAANVSCLVLVHRQRHRGAHMRASAIFSANDVIANAGVMLAGGLVAWSGSRWPDLLVGTAIALVVLAGARRILQLR